MADDKTSLAARTSVAAAAKNTDFRMKNFFNGRNTMSTLNWMRNSILIRHALSDVDGGAPFRAQDRTSAFLRRRGLDSIRGSARQYDRFRIGREAKRFVTNSGMIFLALREQMRKGGRAAGPNGERIDQVSRGRFRFESDQLARELAAGTYRPGPTRPIKIPKGSGRGTRTIEVANWQDQVVQRTIVSFLELITEGYFLPHSFGFLRQRNRGQAIMRAEQFINQDRRFVIVADIKDAFGQIAHEPLLDAVNKLAGNRWLTALVRKIVSANRRRGIAQGGSLSPLLLNVFLDRFLDKQWRRQQNCPLLRYADDILIACRTREEAEHAYSLLRELLLPIGMKLKGNFRSSLSALNEDQAADWLGYRISRRGNTASIGLTPWFRQAAENCILRAIEGPDGALLLPARIQETIRQLAPCYPHAKRHKIILWVRNLAIDQQMSEIPSVADLELLWRKCYQRLSGTT